MAKRGFLRTSIHPDSTPFETLPAALSHTYLPPSKRKQSNLAPRIHRLKHHQEKDVRRLVDRNMQLPHIPERFGIDVPTAMWRCHCQTERRHVLDGNAGLDAQHVHAARLEPDFLDAEQPLRGGVEFEGSDLAAHAQVASGRNEPKGAVGELGVSSEGFWYCLLGHEAVVAEDVRGGAAAAGGVVVLLIGESEGGVAFLMLRR